MGRTDFVVKKHCVAGLGSRCSSAKLSDVLFDFPRGLTCVLVAIQRYDV